MLDSYDVVFRHVVLPDSLAERRQVLMAMARILKQSHPAHREIQRQITALDGLDAHQQRLNLQFTSVRKDSQ